MRCSATATCVDAGLAKRKVAESRVQEARAAVGEAERSLQAARREAARVGGELAAVNQFLRHQTAAPGGAPTLAEALDVDPGYELALAAALDGRLRAAVVEHRKAGSELLDRSGSEGGRALIAGAPGEPHGGSAPVADPRKTTEGAAAAQRRNGADPLIAHVHGADPALGLARALLRDTWVVDELAPLPDGFEGVAVTRSGRVWSSRTREIRQAPALGEDRLLAERNRREQLVAASEASACAELEARSALERASADCAQAEGAREERVAAHRGAVHALDEAAEEQRRIEAQIERRRAAPDDGPSAGRRSQLMAQLAAERQMLARAQRERGERAERMQRLDAAIAADRELVPTLKALIAALENASGAIADQLAAFDEALDADRRAGESVAGELRTCAQQEVTLHSRLQHENEAVTEAEVRLQRARDQAADSQRELRELAAQLELAAEPAAQDLTDEERDGLNIRLQRLARRREQIGPVNPLAQVQYAEAVEHVEELEHQRADLEAALRELEKLIADTDRQIRTSFQQMFAATASGFEELAQHLFPGGSGRLRLVSERPGPARVLGGEAPVAEADDGEQVGEADGEEGPVGGTGGGSARGRDRDHPSWEGVQAPVAAVRRGEVADRASVLVRRLPGAAVPVLHPR